MELPGDVQLGGDGGRTGGGARWGALLQVFSSPLTLSLSMSESARASPEGPGCRGGLDLGLGHTQTLCISSEGHRLEGWSVLELRYGAVLSLHGPLSLAWCKCPLPWPSVRHLEPVSSDCQCLDESVVLSHF